MAEERVFYKTTVSIVVLSEEPLGDDWGMKEVVWACDEGPCVGYALDMKSEARTGKQMADDLLEAGSEPEFFQLDDDGVHEDDRED